MKRKLYSVVDWYDYGADTYLVRAKNKGEVKKIVIKETGHIITLEDIEQIETKDFVRLSSVHE